MMTEREFQECLADLRLSPTEAARLLSVNTRTVRRWSESPEEIPGPAEQALRAWQRLNRFGLAWRPDGLPIGEDDPDFANQIALYREHAIQLDALIRKVKARGGPTVAWEVDVEGGEAKLGPVTVGFYLLPNGKSFSPSTYRRGDREPDLVRDATLIEDAYFCIAQALAAVPRRK